MKKSITKTITSKLFEGSVSRKRVAPMQASLVLALLLCLLIPQKGWAEIVTTTYDFTNKGDKVVTYGDADATYTNCNYFTKIGNVSDPGRFAAQGAGAWVFERSNSQGVWSDTPGFCNNNSGNRRFLVSKLYAGDVVTFDVVNLGNASQTISLDGACTIATASGNTFTMSAKGPLVVIIPSVYSIKSITIQHDNSAAYAYDPAIEIYDLSGINTGNASTLEGTPGYQLGGEEAHYLANPSNYSLNNRFVVSVNNFTWNNGLKTTKNSNQWRVLAINDLKAGDRVVITYNGTTMEFGSSHLNNTDFAAANIVFKDENNNGELDEGEVYLQGGNQVESEMIYTMEKDGHLDIRVPGGATITKIVIYGDHQAAMEDRYNGSASTGYTAYFSSTGQLLAKEHIVPGGLEVHIGNENNNQHAIVVSSDQGPVSFVYDQEHFKMARQSDNGTNIEAKAPATGTFYKFMPEVDGYMTVRFKAYNVRYDHYNWGEGTDSGNEKPMTSGTCPYYIMVKNSSNQFSRYQHPNGNTEWGHDHSTGDNGGFTNIRVTSGNTYYVYGWWSKDSQGRQPGTSDWNLYDSYCGVAQLIDVTFIPDNMVTPLAKWVESGTEEDDDLADVTGYTTSDLHIKKMSDNITNCEPYIYETTVNGQTVKKLGIRNITFADGANPGGTILIKLGSPSNDANPVFAYTIAYDASWNNGQGHTWDFSTNPLKGLKWTNTSGQADAVNFSTSTDQNGLLYQEMHETNPDGTPHSDWTYSWRVKKGDTVYDPMFLNKYDMEGDNADMMWDTEGLIINTASNQSAINNEYTDNGGVIDHSNTTNRPDPDRYVGILPGGEFRIPNLKEGDRVIVYMGSGEGSGADAIYLNIDNALDAIGTEITDEYRAGGSLWQASSTNQTQAHGTPEYKGAYHFIAAADGDMVFTLANKGTLAKLYSIELYSGVHRHTNDPERAVREYNGTNYNVNGYQYTNSYKSNDTQKGCYSLHWRGKGEGLRNPSIIYQTGNVSTGTDNLFAGIIGTNPFIFYKSVKGEYGMFRMRVEDMDLGGKYVADYGLQNISVGYVDKVDSYPYTWDFTDLMKYAYTDNANRLPKVVDSADDFEDISEFMDYTVNLDDQRDTKAVHQWKWYDEVTGQYAKPAGYGLHIRNSAFSGEMAFPVESQLYAGDEIIAEAQGLDFIPYSNEAKRNGRLLITDEGIALYEQGGNYWRVKIPEVPSTAAVYVRAKQIGERAITAGVGAADTPFTYVGTASDDSGDMIYAVKGTGADMTLFLSNIIVKKIAISTDAKTVNKLGYASESRTKEIDPELMGYMTGTGLKAYTVSKVEYDNKPGEFPTVTLTAVNMNTTTNKKYVIGPATHHDNNAYIIYNTDETTKAVKILDNGFHLFVPDMHDKSTADSPQKEVLPVSGNGLRAWLPEYDSEDPDYDVMSQTYNYSTGTNGSITATGAGEGVNDYTTYVLSSKGTNTVTNVTETDVERFRRVKEGTHAGTNKAYLPLLTAKVKPSTNNGNQAKGMFAIVFVDEEEGTETTSLDGVESIERTYDDGSYYTLGGVKVQNPTKKGIYIKNGKKVVIK